MFVSTLRSRASVHAMRTMSTHAAQGLATILEKRPDDVVITFAKRTAMGRHRKGQFKDSPVDEMMQALYKVRSATGARTTGHSSLPPGNYERNRARPPKNRGYMCR
jgi:hypothetical protein